MEFTFADHYFSIPTVFRCSFLPRVVSLLFSVVKVTRLSAIFFNLPSWSTNINVRIYNKNYVNVVFVKGEILILIVIWHKIYE